MHGGAAKQVRAAGARRVAEAKAAAMAVRWATEVDVSPTEAILMSIRQAAGEVAFYRAQIDALPNAEFVWGMTKEKRGLERRAPVGDGTDIELTEEGWAGDDQGRTFEAKPPVWLELYERTRRDLVKFSTEALRIGIEARRVHLAEQQGDLIVDVIKEIIRELGLLEWQERRVPIVVPAALRRLSQAETPPA